jgi:fatty acid desaturase
LLIYDGQELYLLLDNIVIFICYSVLITFYRKKAMKQNMGQTDRLIRAVIGAAIILIGLITHSWWGAVGLVPLLTSLAGFCPLYTLLKISTCPTTERQEKPAKGGVPKS